MASTPLLDNYKAYQSSTLGDWTRSTMSAPSTASRQYRQQAEAFNMGSRLLRRNARQGDVQSALAYIGFLDKANQAGFAPGGISSSEENRANAQQYEQRLGLQNQIRTDSINRTNAIGQSSLLSPPTSGPSLLQSPPAAATAPSAATTAAPASYTPPVNRNYAGLGLLEGYGLSPMTASASKYEKSEGDARLLGVQDPTSILKGDRTLTYHRLLDQTLGQAKTPEEIAALRQRALMNGISGDAFDQRAKWWETNRK